MGVGLLIKSKLEWSVETGQSCGVRGPVRGGRNSLVLLCTSLSEEPTLLYDQSHLQAQAQSQVTMV